MKKFLIISIAMGFAIAGNSQTTTAPGSINSKVVADSASAKTDTAHGTFVYLKNTEVKVEQGYRIYSIAPLVVYIEGDPRPSQTGKGTLLRNDIWVGNPKVKIQPEDIIFFKPKK